jgi:acyl-CoA synthetase (AMP-forming)/AMP-acid ligase II
LPRPKRPSAFHLVQELPLGPTGKVARHRLRDREHQALSL